MREHASGCAAVEVATAVERLDHRLARCHVGEDAQLQLAIVSHHQLTAFRCPEGFANEVSVLLECRLVLQVGPAARQATCLGVQIHTTMHAAILQSISVVLNQDIVSLFAKMSFTGLHGPCKAAQSTVISTQRWASVRL